MVLKKMGKIGEFLKFEKKKVVLPIILVLIFMSFVSFDRMYATNINGDLSGIVDSALERLKVEIYAHALVHPDFSYTLNYDEQQRIIIANLSTIDPVFYQEYMNAVRRENVTKEVFANFLSDYWPLYATESVINIFGYPSELNCMVTFPTRYCVITESGFALPKHILRLIANLAWFLGNYTNVNSPIGAILKSNDTERVRQFVHSETGQNPWTLCGAACNFKLQDFENRTKMETYEGAQLGTGTAFKFDGSYHLKILTTSDIVMYAVMLFVIGYVVSSIWLFGHRKNKILNALGARAYLMEVILFIIFFFSLVYIQNRYDLWSGITSNIVFLMTPFFFVLVAAAYVAATVILWINGKSKERKIIKHIRKAKRGY